MKESEHTRQYDAFISYKHGEIDSFAAEKTQQLLEHFHIPKHLASQWGIQPIETVFVDNGELSSSAAFSVYALQQTRSLSNQYRQTVLSQSQYLAKEAMDLLNEGDPMGAIQKALQALPADTDDRALINPDAVYALTQSVVHTRRRQV